MGSLAGQGFPVLILMPRILTFAVVPISDCSDLVRLLSQIGAETGNLLCSRSLSVGIVTAAPLSYNIPKPQASWKELTYRAKRAIRVIYESPRDKSAKTEVFPVALYRRPF